MRTIYLHGTLGEQFGKKYLMDISSPAEAVVALGCQLPRFTETIRDGAWEVRRGNTPIMENEQELLSANLNTFQDVHILPAVEGNKEGGVGKVILGVALFAAAAAVPGSLFGTGGIIFGSSGAVAANVAVLGATIALQGVSQMISPVPEMDTDYSSEEDVQRNGLLGGRGNTSQAGAPVPVLFGRMRTGSHIIQAGYTSEKLEAVEWIQGDTAKNIDMTTGTRVYSGNTFVGASPLIYGRRFDDLEDDEEWTSIQPIGTLSSYAYRNHDIYGIQQRYDGANYFFELLLEDDNRAVGPQEDWTWLSRVRIDEEVFSDADGVSVDGVDQTTALSTGGAGNISVFVADDDYMIFDNIEKFDEIVLTNDAGTVADESILPTFEYSTGTSTWSEFNPIDNTQGFSIPDETIRWNREDIDDWVTGATGNYEIRVTRTKDALVTVPVLDLVQIREWSEVINLLPLSVDEYNDRWTIEPSPYESRGGWWADGDRVEDDVCLWRWNLDQSYLTDSTNYRVFLEYYK